MNLHYLQLQILKKLSLRPHSSFSQIHDPTILSNQFAYHLKELVNSNLVEKTKDEYVLSNKGKKLINQINVQSETPDFNKEPKISIKCHVFDGEYINSRILVNRRLKEPYYGFNGVVAGSVRYGTTLLDNVKHHVKLKTGLVSDNIQYYGVAQVQNFDKNTEELLDDKIFHIFVMFNAKGKLIDSLEGYENYWINANEFLNLEKIHYGQKEIFSEVLKDNKSIFLQLNNLIDQF